MGLGDHRRIPATFMFQRLEKKVCELWNKNILNRFKENDKKLGWLEWVEWRKNSQSFRIKPRSTPANYTNTFRFCLWFVKNMKKIRLIRIEISYQNQGRVMKLDSDRADSRHVLLSFVRSQRIKKMNQMIQFFIFFFFFFGRVFSLHFIRFENWKDLQQFFSPNFSLFIVPKNCLRPNYEYYKNLPGFLSS